MRKISLLVLLGLGGCASQAEDFLYGNSMFPNKRAEALFYGQQHAPTISGSVDGHSVTIRSYPEIGLTTIYASP